MSSTISPTTMVVPATRFYAPAKAAPPAPAATNREPLTAAAKVDLAYSRVSYTASLGALKTANKTMMGYLLNIVA